MKKLKINRETISILSSSDLSHVQGAGTTIIIIRKTTICPIGSNICSGGPCVETTIGTSGTSVINPSGG